MVQEDIVRRALGIKDSEHLQERGIYHPPSRVELAQVPPSREPGAPSDLLLAEEWLSDSDLAEHFSEDSALAAVLPQGTVKRLDIDPRIIVVEGLPEPTRRLGDIRSTGTNAWIIDSRDGPTALAVAQGDHEIVFWIDNGAVRLFALRRDSAASEERQSDRGHPG